MHGKCSTILHSMVLYSSTFTIRCTHGTQAKRPRPRWTALDARAYVSSIRTYTNCEAALSVHRLLAADAWCLLLVAVAASAAACSTCCPDHSEPNTLSMQHRVQRSASFSNTLSMPQRIHKSSSEFNPASSSVVEAELGSAFGLAVDRNSQLELLPPS